MTAGSLALPREAMIEMPQPRDDPHACLAARLVRDAGQIVAVSADNDNGRWGMELLQAVMQNVLR